MEDRGVVALSVRQEARGAGVGSWSWTPVFR